MKIKTIKKEGDVNSPVLWIDEVRLTISDGIRFGFGFGMGIFFWLAILIAASGTGIIFLIREAVSEFKLF